MKLSLVNLTSIIIVLLCILLTLSGCGSAKVKDALAENGMDIITSEEYISESEEFSDDLADSTTSAEVTKNRKIIENIGLSVQTKEFDKLMKSLNETINLLGGYIESSSIYGREYDSDDNRTANLTVRIPSSKSSNFTDFVSESSVVIHKTVDTEDVTLSYVDMESRVEVLEAEKESLEKLLKSATSMEDIIKVREKLTDVITQIESYKTQLRTYDNLVDYSTITLDIYEVERTKIVEKQTVWQKIGTNLKDGFRNVWNVLVNIFVFFISSIPYMLPFLIIGAIVLTIIIFVKNRHKTK